MAIEFVVQPKELAKALRFILPTNPRTRRARAEFVEVSARKSEIEFASASVASSFPAQVVCRGHARAPVWVLDWFRKVVTTLRLPSVHVSIADGHLKAEHLTYNHPDITVQARRRIKSGPVQ